MKKTIVHILSTPHSGSTLLDLILSSHSKTSSLGEFSQIKKKTNSKQIICKLCGSDCKYWSQLRKKPKKNKKPAYYHNEAFRIFNTPFLIDSSKRIKWIKETISPDINIKVIKLTRFGLATLLKKKKRTGSINKTHIKKWMQNSKQKDIFLSSLKPSQKLSIKYEDLCENPQKIIKQCCDFIGIEYEEGMLDFWKTKHHIINGNSKPICMVRLYHKTADIKDMSPDVVDFFERNGFSLKLDTRFMEEFSPSEIKLFDDIAGKFCKRYGY